MAGESTRNIWPATLYLPQLGATHLTSAHYRCSTRARKRSSIRGLGGSRKFLSIQSVRRIACEASPWREATRRHSGRRRTCARMAGKGLAEGRNPGGRVKRRVDVETIHPKRHATSFDAIADLPVLATRTAPSLPTSSLSAANANFACIQRPTHRRPRN